MNREVYFFFVRFVAGEALSVKANRGAKVTAFFDFQATFANFAVASNLGFKAVNPVDSWRGAKVRRVSGEPIPAAYFLFDSFACPAPFDLGVQK